MERFICPLCGNSDEKYIGYRNGEPYCRLCLSFKGKQADYYPSKMKQSEINISYNLSNEQKALSKNLLDNFQKGFNSFVYAVCGSGKTEIVLEIIKYCISVGYKVGFAVPRKDVAQELYFRFKNIFIKNKITLVCGGHSEHLYGDLIVFTTHQLYRYDAYFDLLIIDEVDAFPFKGNVVLQKFFDRSIRKNYIMLSATPDDSYLADFKKRGGKVVHLFSRFHGYPLPVPQIKISPEFLMFLILIKIVTKFINEKKQIFIFAPTISLCEETAKKLNIVFPNLGTYVHSQRKDREKVISSFKEKQFLFLVTTAVLERGITVKNLQVIVYFAHHKIYDKYSLVQIAGRAGRKADAPTGEVYYVASKKTKAMDESIIDIERANKDLQNLL